MTRAEQLVPNERARWKQAAIDPIKAALTRLAGGVTGFSTVLESAGALLLDPLQRYPAPPGKAP